MADLLSERAASDGGAVFLESSSRRLSYAEVEALVAARAAQLGDRTGCQVVVRPAPELDSVIELLAVSRSGATMVVIGPDRPDAVDLIERAAADPRPAHTVLFTSGSSGRPKGVRLTAENWAAAARASTEALGHGLGDRWLCVLPLHHVGGLSIIHRSVCGGGAVVLEPDLDRAGHWLDRVDFASVVPTQLYRLLSSRSEAYSTSPVVLVGGGPVDRVLLEGATDAGLRVLATYGMTETTAQAATARIPGGPLFPLPGVEIATDPDGQIMIRGKTVMSGYLGEPERAAGEWFFTTDRGVIHPDRSLEVMGRTGRLIITGGENVDSSEVEAIVAGHRGVSEVVILGVADPEWGEMVVAAYVGEADEIELSELVRIELPAFARPKRWLQVDVLPRTELGKVDVVALTGRLSASGGGPV
ncbi:MAG: AMP-binding protein [Acidimicrobiia bacterium]|nr:AMP-binding protein [Acidimicrobiia bacterium]